MASFTSADASVVRSRLGGVPLWILWIPVVWLASFPLGFTTEPQWSRVHAVPFTDPADKLRDLVVNVLLFVPFGFWSYTWRRTLWTVVASAVIVSISAEAMQLFSALRYPSGTDVLCAGVGALLGAVAAAMFSPASP